MTLPFHKNLFYVVFNEIKFAFYSKRMKSVQQQKPPLCFKVTLLSDGDNPSFSLFWIIERIIYFHNYN